MLLISSDHGYDVVINPSDSRIYNFFSENNFSKALVITDENVDALYSKSIDSFFSSIEYKKVVLAAGEHSKSFESLMKIYDECVSYGISRTDLIAAFGGGVVGDTAGFAAASFCRGVNFIQIPTTLTAQVDSSIGAKVGVNLPQGKNLVGCFYRPKAVFIDTSFLSSLLGKVFSDGMAEVIKYSLISDRELFETLSAVDDIGDSMTDIVERCCRIKLSIVNKDELDRGFRMILNFGHTLGHALEKYFEYKKYTHGECVAMGMYYMTRVSEKYGFCSGVSEKLEKLLTKFSLPVELPVSTDELIPIISTDKKRLGSVTNLILLTGIGDVFIKPVENSRLRDFLSL